MDVTNTITEGGARSKLRDFAPGSAERYALQTFAECLVMCSLIQIWLVESETL